MNKREIIDVVYQQSNMSKRDVTSVINTFLASIVEYVSQGEKVSLSGFGTFYQIAQKERQIFSPIAKKKIDVPAGFNLVFKPSKGTKVLSNTNNSGD